MRWISPAVLALALAMGQPVSAAPAGDLVAGDVLASADLVKYWQCPVPLRPDEALSDLCLVDENLYALTDMGAVCAIDADVDRPVRGQQRPACDLVCSGRPGGDAQRYIPANPIRPARLKKRARARVADPLRPGL